MSRGSEAANAVEQASVGTSRYEQSDGLACRGELDELELNPVIVHPSGAGVSVVDVLARWSSL